MLGVRFLDVDFMRINFACPCPSVYITCFSCIVVKGGAAVCAAIAMQGGGTGADARHEAAARAARPTSFLSCHYVAPGRGTFWFQIFIQAPSPEVWRKTISGGEGGCWRGSGVACFGLPPLAKIIGGVTAIVSYRPGG